MIQCSHYDQIMNNPKESSYSDRRGSHNAGKDCGSCHNNNSNWEASGKWWTISGTVFDNSDRPKTTATTIEFWDQPGRRGNLIKKLQSDPAGNFYTNKIIDFSKPLYPVIYSNDTNSLMGMATAYYGGSCAKCHNDPNVTGHIISN